MTVHVHSLKRHIRLTILILIILLAFSFLLFAMYDFYFVPRVHSVENDLGNYLETIVSSKGQSHVPTPHEIPHLLNEISSIPFVTHKVVQEIESSLRELKKSPDRASLAFHTMRKADVLLSNSSHKVTEMLMIAFVLMTPALIIILIFLYSTLRKHVFSEIESISTDLLKFDLSHTFKSKVSSYAETKELVKGFNLMARRVALYRLVLNSGASSESLREFAKGLYDGLKKLFNVNRLSIAEVVENEMTVKITLSDSKNVLIDEGFTQDIGSDCLNKIKEKGILVINDIEAYLKEHPESFMNFIYDEGMRSAVMLSLCLNKCDGILFLNSFEKGAFKEYDIEDLKAISKILSQVYKEMLTVQNLILSTLTGFTKLVEEKDEETGDHLIRMATYSRIIAKELAKEPKFSEELSLDFIEQIYKQAPLHDIGKVGIPDYILQKPGKLDDDEFEIMKTHTTIGYEILERIDSQTHERYFDIGKNIVRSHHERWDGGGYPDGLKGEEIPLCARIVAVADVFDALTSERPYKKALDYDESFRIIIEGSGTHFDPKVVNAFVKAQPEIKKLYNKFRRFFA